MKIKEYTGSPKLMAAGLFLLNSGPGAIVEAKFFFVGGGRRRIVPNVFFGFIDVSNGRSSGREFGWRH